MNEKVSHSAQNIHHKHRRVFDAIFMVVFVVSGMLMLANSRLAAGADGEILFQALDFRRPTNFQELSFSPVLALFVQPILFFAPSMHQSLFQFISVFALFLLLGRVLTELKGKSTRYGFFALFILLFSGPMLESIFVGQYQCLHLIFFVLMLQSLVCDRRSYGFYLSILICLQPQNLLFLIPFVMRGMWRPLIDVLCSIASLVASTLLFWGTEPWQRYFYWISEIFQAPSSHVRNQSFVYFLTQRFEVSLLYTYIILGFILLAGCFCGAMLLRSQMRQRVAFHLVWFSFGSYLFPNVWYHDLIFVPFAALFMLIFGANTRSGYLGAVSLISLQLDRFSSGLVFTDGLVSFILTAIGSVLLLADVMRSSSPVTCRPRVVQQYLKGSLLLLAVGCVVVEMMRLAFRLAITGYVFDMDSFVYAGWGRAINNGLKIYSEVYNNKGPGLAVFLSGCMKADSGLFMCALWQQMLLLICAVCIIARIFIHSDKSGCQGMTPLRFALAAIVLSFLNFGAANAPGLQAEALALGPALLFITYTRFPLRIASVQLFLSGLLAAYVVSLKEPMLGVVIVSVMIFYSRNSGIPIQLVRVLSLTTVLFFATLFIQGSLDDYISIYLVDVFTNILWRGNAGPLAERGFEFTSLLENYASYSPLLSTLCISLVVLVPLVERFSIGVVTAKCLLCLYCLSVLVSSGGIKWNHHYVMAIPFFFACAMHVVESVPQVTSKVRFCATYGLVITLACLLICSTRLWRWGHPGSEYSDIWYEAKAIDEAIRDCGWSNYGFVGRHGVQPYAFTQYSPIGPLFFQLWDVNATQLLSPWLKNLEVAEFVVVEGQSLSDIDPSLHYRSEIINVVNRAHTASPPKCAESALLRRPLRGQYLWLFRNTL